MCRSMSGKWTLIGVTSWGEKCGQKGKPGVYSKVGDIVSWIHDKINTEGAVILLVY